MDRYDEWVNQLRKNLDIESFFDLTMKHNEIKMEIFSKDSNGFFYQIPIEVLFELMEIINILKWDYDKFLDAKTKTIKEEKAALTLTKRIITMRIEKYFMRELKKNRKLK